MIFKEEAKKHAIEEAPSECCGIVVDDIYYRCNNISDTPKDNFAIHPKDFLKARSKGNYNILFIVTQKEVMQVRLIKKLVKQQKYLGTFIFYQRTHGKL